MPALEPVKGTLRHLSLIQNVIWQFSNSYFINYTQLDTLGLSRNELTYLPNFLWLEKSIWIIKISGNQIQSLDAISSHGCYKSLTYLDASSNLINYLNVSHLERFPKLLQLLLRENRLTAIEDYRAYFHGIIIELRLNPWHCDSKLAWMSGFNSSRLTCHSPECFRGKFVSEISEHCFYLFSLSVPHTNITRPWPSPCMQGPFC